jgi:hypothetical protein
MDRRALGGYRALEESGEEGVERLHSFDLYGRLLERFGARRWADENFDARRRVILVLVVEDGIKWSIELCLLVLRRADRDRRGFGETRSSATR